MRQSDAFPSRTRKEYTQENIGDQHKDQVREKLYRILCAE